MIKNKVGWSTISLQPASYSWRAFYADKSRDKLLASKNSKFYFQRLLIFQEMSFAFCNNGQGYVLMQKIEN